MSGAPASPASAASRGAASGSVTFFQSASDILQVRVCVLCAMLMRATGVR